MEQYIRQKQMYPNTRFIMTARRLNKDTKKPGPYGSGFLLVNNYFPSVFVLVALVDVA